MSFTSDTNVTTLIEQRIRDQVKGEASPALAEFELTVEAAINKLGVFAPMTPIHSLVGDVRTKHIENLVNKRIDALVGELVTGKRTEAPSQHVGERIIPQAASPGAADRADAVVAPGATVIIECDQALTNQQKEAAEAHALSKLPAGCKVLVLDRGLKARVSVTTSAMSENFTPAGRRTVAQGEQDSAQEKPAGEKRGIDLVVRKCELQERIRTAVEAETNAFFEETGIHITSLDVQFVRQRFLNNRERHVVGAVDAAITLG